MDETTIDLKDIVGTIKKRRNLIGNVILGSVALALLSNFLISPTYEAETSLRVKQSKGLANSLLTELPTGSSFNAKQLMLTYAEILKSRTVVQAVIDKTAFGTEEIPKYENMVTRITTLPAADTEILKIKVKGKSPIEAQLLANTLVETFNNRLVYLVRAEQSAVRDFIGDRVKESRLEVDKAESALEQYKREQKILTPTDETRAMVDRLTDIKKLTAENTVNAAVAQAKLNTVRQQLGQENPGLVADSPLIQQYKGKLADLEVELVGVSQNYGNKHPRVLALSASVTETKEKLNAELARVIHAETPSLNIIHQGLLQTRIQAEAEIAAATAQRDAIGRVMSQGEQELKALPAKEQGISRLMRDSLVAQEIYIMLAKRYEEARISEVMQPTDVQVIDVAISPENPIAPKKMQNVLIAMLLGAMVGTGVAFYQEYANRTINTAKEAKQCLGLPILGSIPDFDSNTSSTRYGPLSRIKDKLAGKE